ncbi:UvrD-helicase domain-containing protein [Aliikangiella marina]|uniref:UvrD-helicase domain-containing protein n=1 Tax=Aliikangiella marina TaxID=1712262 RepID=UPI00163DABF3|nr:UvrD-helicase domain-containing protein [Aliikangiella marina]
MKQTVIDQETRYELLNPRGSFIVQAPAGSGKTELLTQRILALLAVVDKPENILAITFTRKAAAEMQNRVVAALLLGAQPEPEAAHEKYRWKLAQKVLQRDKQLSWNLLENASRLNITTIDSLSASLSSALPLLSQTGALPKIAENAHAYYLEAAENTLQAIESDDQIAEDIIRLLRHKDNNLSQLTELLAQLLAKRLQWMASVTSGHSESLTQELLNSLSIVTQERLEALFELFPTDIISELPELMNQAGEVLRLNNKSGKPFLIEVENIGPLKTPTAADINIWKAISELFLKAGNKPELLSKFNVSHGFPAVNKSNTENENARYQKNKKQVEEIAAQLSQDKRLINLLFQIKKLPATDEQERNQQVLASLVKLLPISVAHLKLVFSRYNVIDFSELAITSLQALGHGDMPSDLALALDYRIEHILIDEFQDTSTPQIELINLLTAGWEQDERGLINRSLFLVGDPMQSIYRFRDANVSLFMKIREQGIGSIRLAFRQVKVNFRSNAVIVDWVNQQFQEIMPTQEDLTVSAVSYAQSVAFNHRATDSQVNALLTVDAQDHFTQDHKVIELVNNHLKENQSRESKKTLAILGRSRNNLSEIIQLLNQHNIAFQALEIDLLSQKMIVRDLMSLAFALLDHYDEVSWAACMRSPWFGLKLDDIRKVFVNGDKALPIIERIEAEQAFLSQASQARCAKILPLLAETINQKGFKPFRKWLYGCFKAVGGLYQMDFDSDYDDLLVCLDKLAELQAGGELNDRLLVEESINQLFAAPNPRADSQVQVMTIHKSKGLEFDTVILPRLDATGRSSDHVLLKWTEVIGNNGEPHNLLAVSKETGQENDGVYQYIAYLDSEKSRYEDQRVLYVAATRAKSNLYLLGNLVSDSKTGEMKRPQASSFLGMLWQGIKGNYTEIPLIAEPVDRQETPLFESRMIKQVNHQRILTQPIDVQETNAFSNQETGVATPGIKVEGHQPVSQLAAATGRVLHKQLQWLSAHFDDEFQVDNRWRRIISSQLKNEYYFSSSAELNDSVEKVVFGIENMLQDELGKQILSSSNNAYSEVALHKKLNSGSYLTRIIDRTFVKDDVRWIVDYKSSIPSKEETLEQFVTREKAVYLDQLTDYFKMFQKLEDRSIIAGLYFPMLAHFEPVLRS